MVNAQCIASPQHNQAHCSRCGAKSLEQCADCGVPIRGAYHVYAWGTFNASAVPAFCGECGKPFPWTETALRAAREFTHELKELSDIEKEEISRSLTGVLSDGPKTPAAVMRIKELAQKAGKAAMEGLKSILINVACEATKKALWP